MAEGIVRKNASRSALASVARNSPSLPMRGALADERQRHRGNRHAEDAQRKLHQPERVVEPRHRAVALVAGEGGVDHHVDLHRARRDDRRAHQAQDGAHALVAPLEVRPEAVADLRQRGQLHGELQKAAQQRANAIPTSARAICRARGRSAGPATTPASPRRRWSRG